MRSFVLSLTGRDRPGIVEAVTRALLDHDVNIEDSEMGILRGHFAVMLVLSAPAELDETALRRELDRVRAEIPLETVTLDEVAAIAAGATEASHAISVYGADHPGIVHGVAAVLAAHGVNVVDMSTRVVGGAGEAALYVMLLEVALPAGLDEERLGALLAEVARDQGVDVSVRPLDSDVL